MRGGFRDGEPGKEVGEMNPGRMGLGRAPSLDPGEWERGRTSLLAQADDLSSLSPSGKLKA